MYDAAICCVDNDGLNAQLGGYVGNVGLYVLVRHDILQKNVYWYRVKGLLAKSISQLMVSTGCIPRWRKAKLAAPIPSKKLRCTTDVSWNSLRDSCWMRFCPPDPVTSAVRPDGQLLFFVGSAPGSCPGPCCP